MKFKFKPDDIVEVLPCSKELLEKYQWGEYHPASSTPLPHRYRASWNYKMDDYIGKIYFIYNISTGNERYPGYLLKPIDKHKRKEFWIFPEFCLKIPNNKILQILGI